jgi:Tfp pilus assembly protein PilE
MRARIDLADQRGTTLIEMLVALASGLVVVSALTALIITTLHGSARVSARVDATQRARIALTRVMEQLHSSCVAPEVAPIQKASTGTSLEFIHQTGSAVSPVPIISVISLSGGTLSQQDYSVTGTAPNWTRSTAIGGPRILLTNVSATAPSSSIFSYYRYTGGTISATPLATPLETEAALTVEVRAALTAAPLSTPVKDTGSSASVQNSTTLRLTPPSFNEGSPARPCQ